MRKRIHNDPRFRTCDFGIAPECAADAPDPQQAGPDQPADGDHLHEAAGRERPAAEAEHVDFGAIFIVFHQPFEALARACRREDNAKGNPREGGGGEWGLKRPPELGNLLS